MSQTSLGSLCIVLHGHLPYVLNHGTAPHGEAWLFEAAAETYLPLLSLLDRTATTGVRAALTVGLTPILLEQLRQPRFAEGFRAYLRERAERAARDRAEFESAGDARMAQRAHEWEQFYQRAGAQFESLGGDLVARFALHASDGQIQILTSAATHPYMPLLLTDQSLRAQMELGTRTTQRHVGKRSTGMWLPECAYRPTFDHWKPPILFDDPRHRPGLETFVAAAGVSHFFIDGHMLENADAVAARDGSTWRPVDYTQLHLDATRGWRQQFSPVGVVSSTGAPPRVFAFARHPLVSETIWSATVGYPGSPEYLDFHRRHGERGLRYHRVTDNQSDLGSKEPYDPAAVDARLRENAEHFCSVVTRILSQYLAYTGRPGVVVAPFDAELFGHWWFEGPRFLSHVIDTLSKRSDVRLATAEEALARFEPDKAVRLPDASWGKYGNNSTWFNDKTQWMWEIEYRSEIEMVKAASTLPWRTAPAVRDALTHAARQLLLMQASDWPFVIHSQGAVDYGIRRFAGHATGFDRAITTATHLAAGHPPTDVQQIELADLAAHDPLFPDLDLTWWTP